MLRMANVPLAISRKKPNISYTPNCFTTNRRRPRMFRLATALLFIATSAWAAGPEDSIVRVIVRAHDKVLATKSGLVIPEGFVVTTFHKFGTITNVDIIVAGHDPVQARGVVAYNFPENLMLMRIDWEGEVPPSAVLADAPPAKGQPITLLGFGRGAEQFKMNADAGVTKFAFGGFRHEPTLGGSSLLHEGKVVGVLTGAHVTGSSAGFDPEGREPPTGLLAARVELIRALIPGEAILWSKWNKKFETIRRADQIFSEGAKDADIMKATRDKDLKQFADAWTRTCKQVLEIDPFHGRAWALLTMLQLYANKQPDEALIAVTHAIALSPADDRLFHARSTIMAGKAEWADAIAAAKTAVRLRPTVSDNHAALGAAYTGNRQYDDAIAEYKEAVRLDPKSTEAAEGLKKAPEWASSHTSK